MIKFLGFALIAVFSALSALHLYWLTGGTRGINAAIPRVEGMPAFTPPDWATALVALAFGGFACLTALLLGIFSNPLPITIEQFAGYAIAVVFALRAIGDFRLVGFTKRPLRSDFARLDTLIYSPLCLAIAASLVAVTQHADAS